MNLKEQTQALWKRCFDDSDAFIRLYFSKRYSDSINHVAEADGQVIAALQTIAYPMTWNQTSVPTAYISGACTHPNHRAKGVMGRLLKQTHQDMHRKGIVLSTLIPAEEWLKEYYARFGYANSFFYSRQETVINNFHLPVDNSQPTFIFKEIDCKEEWKQALYPFFEQEMNKRNYCIQHTLDDLTIVNEDHFLSGGQIFRIYEAGKHEELQGIVWTIPTPSHLFIPEIVLRHPAIQEEVIRQLGIHSQHHQIVCLSPDRRPSATPLGMIRVIHAATCLQLLRQSGVLEADIIRITEDTHIEANNGYYQWQDGSYLRLPHPPACTAPVCSFTLRELTEKCLNRLYPYMSLMMN